MSKNTWAKSGVKKMNSEQALDFLLKSYKRYYDINSETPEPPFDAQAEFHSHGEQYFLMKSAKLSEQDSAEYVYFSTGDTLLAGRLDALSQMSWASGLAKVKPVEGHRDSNVTLILLYNSITDQAKKTIRRKRLSKVYMLTLRGWSNFRLAAADLSSQKIYTNWHGRDLKKVLKGVLSHKTE